MKSLLNIAGIITVVLFLWTCQDDENEPISESKLEFREFTSLSLKDNPIGNTDLRKIQIYLPRGYENNPSKKYPVIYLLHGLPFTSESFTDITEWDPYIGGNSPFQIYPDFPDEGFRSWVDGLILSGKMKSSILVMPDAGSAYGFSFYSNSILNGGFEDFIVKDVVNYIDANYRTVSNKDGRALIGFSQGGYGAVKLGMKHSDVFSVVAGHSGALYLDGFFGMGALIIAENPDGLKGPDPNKFFTSAAYAMSSAWSPNIGNPPFMVDFPFEYPSGDVVPAVRERWLKNCAFNLLDDYLDGINSLNGVYLDCGTLDELQMTAMVEAFVAKLDVAGVDYNYETFEGGHFDKMFSRLERSLTFASSNLN
ncbi:esterase family protein [Lutimonas saemankumensis]|uniref:alpha/beta hydrolase n=1 Tax=Lutimonas saemankumensis TaxID=483016 RepID=UPI001CD2711F|nr:alpha/beta fold hydrolase [Lutimonas saemankumensis]MCA0930858.1 esterase family protein [Lutimonas saemankumensis]